MCVRIKGDLFLYCWSLALLLLHHPQPYPRVDLHVDAERSSGSWTVAWYPSRCSTRSWYTSNCHWCGLTALENKMAKESSQRLVFGVHVLHYNSSWDRVSWDCKSPSISENRQRRFDPTVDSLKISDNEIDLLTFVCPPPGRVRRRPRRPARTGRDPWVSIPSIWSSTVCPGCLKTQDRRSSPAYSPTRCAPPATMRTRGTTTRSTSATRTAESRYG